MEKTSGKKNWKNRKLGEPVLTTCVAGDTVVTPESSRLTGSIGRTHDTIQARQDKTPTPHVVGRDVIVSHRPKMDISAKTPVSAFVLASGERPGGPKGPRESRLDIHVDGIPRWGAGDEGSP